MVYRPYPLCDFDGFHIFIFLYPRRLCMEFGYKWLSGFRGEKFEIVILWENWVKGKKKDIDFLTHKSLCTYWAFPNTNFEAKIFKTYHEILQSSILHMWPCCKYYEGQPTVIIWTRLKNDLDLLYSFTWMIDQLWDLRLR